MTAIATVEIDAPDVPASQSGHLIDLSGQRVPVVRIARQCHGTDHELSAFAARIGGGDGRLDAELIARAGLPFPDARDFRCMHGVKFVLVAGLLGEDSFSAFKSLPEGPFQLRVPGDLASDVADQAAKPGAQPPNPSRRPCL